MVEDINSVDPVQIKITLNTEPVGLDLNDISIDPSSAGTLSNFEDGDSSTEKKFTFTANAGVNTTAKFKVGTGWTDSSGTSAIESVSNDFQIST